MKIGRTAVTVLALATLCLAAATLAAPARAANTETVTLRSSTGTTTGYLAVPGKPGRYPALVVIHEWWGLTPWVKSETRKFADAGYVALAVDLYHGKVTNNPKMARELMTHLPHARAINDMKAAFNYLASRKDVEPNHIGSVGWCMGGGYSLQLAIHEPRLAACVVNYGELPTDRNELRKITAPVLGTFGGKDPVITPAEVTAFEKTMKELHKPLSAKTYPDATHAFEDSANKAGYRPADAADAWTRTITFLNKTLK